MKPLVTHCKCGAEYQIFLNKDGIRKARCKSCDRDKRQMKYLTNPEYKAKIIHNKKEWRKNNPKPKRKLKTHHKCGLEYVRKWSETLKRTCAHCPPCEYMARKMRMFDEDWYKHKQASRRDYYLRNRDKIKERDKLSALGRLDEKDEIEPLSKDEIKYREATIATYAQRNYD